MSNTDTPEYRVVPDYRKPDESGRLMITFGSNWQNRPDWVYDAHQFITDPMDGAGIAWGIPSELTGEFSEGEYVTVDEALHRYARWRRETADSLERVFDTLSDIVDSVTDEQWAEIEARREWGAEDGPYEARLQTPDGGEFNVTPARVWGKTTMTPGPRQNVDLPIARVPENLRDDGLGDCRLVCYDADGGVAVEGPLHDDGNRQDGLNSICVAIEYPGAEA